MCILVDADAEPDVCRQFQVTGYPTIQFLSPRGVPLERIVGKKPGHQLMMAMQAALQNVARRESQRDENTIALRSRASQKDVHARLRSACSARLRVVARRPRVLSLSVRNDCEPSDRCETVGGQSPN